MRLEAVSG